MEIKVLSQSFIDLLHEEAIKINHIYDDIGNTFDAYGNDTPSEIELQVFYDECDRIYAVCDTIIQNSMRAIEREQKKHGGVREGAGRKKAEPTQQIRVPVSLAPILSALTYSYRRTAVKNKKYDADNMLTALKLLTDKVNKAHELGTDETLANGTMLEHVLYSDFLCDECGGVLVEIEVDYNVCRSCMADRDLR